MQNKILVNRKDRENAEGTSLHIIDDKGTLREESSQTNVILQYKLLAAILRAVCSVIQQYLYLAGNYDGKYDCKIITHYTISQLQCFVLLNNHQYNCNITKKILSVPNILL